MVILYNMYLLNVFSRQSGQKKRRLKEYGLNSVAGASVGGAISSLLSAKNPSNIPKSIVSGIVAGGSVGAYQTYRGRKKQSKGGLIKKYTSNKIFSNDKLTEFSLKSKIGGGIENIKNNPVESAAALAGGLLAVRYGKAGIKTALRASTRLKTNKGFTGGLGKSINISNTPVAKIKQRKAVALGSAFIKGSGNKARKDIRGVKSVIKYIKTGKT